MEIFYEIFYGSLGLEASIGDLHHATVIQSTSVWIQPKRLVILPAKLGFNGIVTWDFHGISKTGGEFLN